MPLYAEWLQDSIKVVVIEILTNIEEVMAILTTIFEPWPFYHMCYLELIIARVEGG